MSESYKVEEGQTLTVTSDASSYGTVFVGGTTTQYTVGANSPRSFGPGSYTVETVKGTVHCVLNDPSKTTVNSVTPVPANIMPPVPQGKPTMSDVKTTQPTPGSFASEMKDMFEGHKAEFRGLMDEHKATMARGFAKQIQAVKAFGGIAGQADQDGDEMLAMMGQLTNNL